MDILNKWYKGKWFPINRAQFYLTAWDEQELGLGGRNDTGTTFISKIMVDNCHQKLVRDKIMRENKVTYCFKMRVNRENPSSKCIYFVFAYDKKETSNSS